MTSGGKKLFVCNCEGTMPLDAKALGKACGENIHVHRQLCRAELGNVESGAAGGDPLLVCCTQEAPVFTETLQQANPETAVTFTNIRERAGWSDEADAATPKIAALLAEAALDVPPARAITLVSEGRVLVYGRDEGAVAAAKQLASRLDATVLLSRPEDVLPPSVTDVALFKGTITAAKGHLGAFEVTVDDYAPPRPFSRAGLEFEAAKNGVGLRFDVILDVAGEAPLFPAPEKRDGYFKPDPGNPAAVQKALFDIADLVGEFEKPIYFAFDANLCAHSRSGVVGCTRCLDVCPTSAISPDGDHVIIDPHICAGCGSCASVCPTGAVTYALPPKEVLFQRLRTLLRTYRKAGGQDPVLLVHDTRHGDEMINMMGRFGRGLPARVLPFAVNEVTQIGFDFLSTAVAYGADRVPILIGPQNRDELTGLEEQIDLVEAALTGLGYGSGRVGIIDAEDPEAVSERLYGFESMSPIPPADFLPMGGNRTLATLALRHLHDNAPQPQDILPLTQGSPFGAVEVDVEGCTLCLACVGACPTGALIDNPETPMLRFAEQACIQCGLCLSTCPESVISLEPRFNFTEEARREMLVKEEEPFKCISCGKPFGGGASIEKTIERLTEHSMFAGDPKALNRLRMCADCRVIDQFDQDEPMASKPRPRPRTTDDYLAERDEGKEEEEE